MVGALLIADTKDYFPRCVVFDLDNVLALGSAMGRIAPSPPLGPQRTICTGIDV